MIDGTEEQKPARSWLPTLGRVIAPLFVLAAGVAVAVALIETSPKVALKKPSRVARLVEVEPIRFSTERTLIHAMGTVQPAREVELRPRVSGEIISVSKEFIPGGRFQKGEKLLQIDPTDFDLAVRQRESDVAQAESLLALELGQQTIAKQEYELLGETIPEEDRGLVLRKPHLNRARATIKAAQAALDQGRLDRARTSVKAPFNATIRIRNVNVGMQVSPVSTLATLTGTDEYWVAVTVAVDQLKWIRIPKSSSDTGSLVRVFDEAAWGIDAFTTGEVIRALPDLEEDGRMAQLLVAVRDPLNLRPENADRPTLILGDYVRVEIEGIALESVVAIDRKLVRDGNHVWVMNDQNQLDVRTVEVVFRGREQMLVKGGLRNGDQLVVTDLAAPVEGMALRTDRSSPQASEAPAGSDALKNRN